MALGDIDFMLLETPATAVCTKSAVSSISSGSQTVSTIVARATVEPRGLVSELLPTGLVSDLSDSNESNGPDDSTDSEEIAENQRNNRNPGLTPVDNTVVFPPR